MHGIITRSMIMLSVTLWSPSTHLSWTGWTDPGVDEGGARVHPGLRLPSQTPADEVKEGFVLCFEDSLQLLGAGRAPVLALPWLPAVSAALFCAISRAAL